jgi:hypothetical protein
MAVMLQANDIIRLLGLEPHPEGGHYRETFRDPLTLGTGRAASTAMYYLLRKGERAGIITPAHRCGSSYAPRPPRINSCSAPILLPVKDRTRWCRPAYGKRPKPPACGLSQAALLRPPSHSKDWNSRRRAGRLHHDLPAVR